MSNINTNDEYGSFVKYSGTAGQHTYSYSSLSLNDSVSDQDQIIVIRQFTPSATFLAADTPDGLGGTKVTGAQTWDSWTLPNTSTSGSDMYTIDTTAKTITMSSTAGDYTWDRSGTTINLPVFSPGDDTLIITRKTAGVNPFVTWASGSRLTSAQLNHETKQLLHLTQEIHDKIFKATDLDPYYGAANGICPLNSSGTVDSTYIDSNTVDFTTLNIVTGAGLADTGTLGDTFTINLNLDPATALISTGGTLTIALDANNLEFTSNVLNVKLKPSGTLLEDSTGIYVDITDSLSTTSSIKALSATAGKTLQDAITLIGTGIQYLGNYSASAQPSPPGTLVAGMTYDVSVAGTTTSPFLTEGASGSGIVVAIGDYLRYKTSGTAGWYKAEQIVSNDLTPYFKKDGTVTATGNFNLGTNKITALGAPAAATDATTKAYVDAVILSDLADVETDTTTQGTMLFRDADSWEPILLKTATPTGTILTTTDNLNDLADLNITSPAENNLLRYNATSGKWVNTGAYSEPQTFYSSGTGVNAFGSAGTGSTYTNQGVNAYGYGDGSARAFELGESPDTTNESSFIVSVDGVIQKASDYSVTGSVLTFDAGVIPPYGSEIYIVVFGITPTVTGAVNGTTGTFSGTLGVTGATTVGGTLTASGATQVNSTLGVTGAATFAGGIIDTLSGSEIPLISMLQIKYFSSSMETILPSQNYWRVNGARCYLAPKKEGNKVLLIGMCGATQPTKGAFAKNIPLADAPDNTPYQWQADALDKAYIISPSETTTAGMDPSTMTQNSNSWSMYSNASVPSWSFAIDTITADDMAAGQVRYDAIVGGYNATNNYHYPQYGHWYLAIELPASSGLDWDNFTVGPHNL